VGVNVSAGGFTPKRRVYVLDFTGDDELDGAEIRARSTSLGTVLGLGDVIGSLGGARTREDIEALPEDEQARVLPAALSALGGMVDSFCTALVSWNLCDEDGAAVPATRAGLLTLDPNHVNRIVRAWQRAVSDVSADLGKELTSGAPSVEASLTMEPLSPSPESCSRPA
jgi:hypothetical protein